MSIEDIQAKLDAAFLTRAPRKLHDLAVSMASFIAEIDTRSIDVAAYIEQRLQPLVPLMRTDVRVEQAVDQMRNDGRKLCGDDAPPSEPKKKPC